MKVLLLKDVPKVGRRYEVKDVANGFALNSLFPRRLAEPVTKEIEARIAKLKHEAAKAGEVAQNLLAENLEILDEKTITMKVKSNEKGHLFSAIHKKDIVEAIRHDLDINIPEDALVLEKAIKETGEHEVTTEGGKKKVKFIIRLLSS